jgi:hypothetical protein
LQREIFHNQNKEKTKYGPIFFQNPVWNNKNLKTISCPNLNQSLNYIHV